mgnify:CR=1 FL=1
MRFLIRVIVNAFAIWVVTLIPALMTVVTPFPPGETLQLVLSLLAVAAVFAIVNSIIGTVIKIVAFPLYILPHQRTAPRDHGVVHAVVGLGTARRGPLARHPRRDRHLAHQLGVRHHPPSAVERSAALPLTPAAP